ncbi:hypothetical protein INT47_008293 [Mucor saturninus]|uniref:NAD(P)-binding domain-containing protein n=1 Tax=Mucor saturninus TaxID=64648 RepID=A0A8H7V6W9_9FUNG|nr:hypothetical protein INT47_008293 [Mucor saturninus]
MLLITSVDDYLGYCIASHLSQVKSVRKDMRVLYSQPSAWIKNFQTKGIDTVKITDCHHPDQLSKAMRNVTQIVLTLGSHPDRVKHCQKLLQVALRSGVKSVLFLSHIGAQSEEHASLYDYGLVENMLIEQEEQMTSVIFRLDFIQQYFHLWAAQVEQTKQWRLPISHETEMCPVDIGDVCQSIEACVIRNDALLEELEDCHVGQVYTLTGPEALKNKQMMQMMSDATRYTNYKNHMCRPMDTRFYLDGLCRDIWFDARIKNETAKSYRDVLETNAYRTKAFSVPHRLFKDACIDYFDWINKTSGSVPVNHIQQFSKVPKTMGDFFQENANSFKPKV